MSEVTRILNAIEKGDPHAAEELRRQAAGLWAYARAWLFEAIQEDFGADDGSESPLEMMDEAKHEARKVFTAALAPDTP